MASQHPFPSTGDGGKILSTEERTICQKICTAKDDITRKRAKALIALDDGCTQAMAGTLSDLTRGQVNYLVTLFRKKGLALFGSEALTSGEPGDKNPADSAKPKTVVKKEKKKKKKKGKGSKTEKKGKKKKKDSSKKNSGKNTKKTGKKKKKKKGKKK